MWRREDVIEELKKDQGERSLRQYAEAVGCTASYLSQVFNGIKEPSETLLDRVNLEREIVKTVVYKKKERKWR